MRRWSVAAMLLVAACQDETGVVVDAGIIDSPPVITQPIPDAALIFDGRPPADGRPDPDASEGDFPCNLRAFTAGVSTLAGCTDPGVVDGNRSVVRFNNPVNVVLGPDGDVYVADSNNNRIRAVKPSGETRTIVYQAGFQKPFGMAFGPDRWFYVMTEENDRGGTTPANGTLWVVDLTARTAAVIMRDVGAPDGMVVLPDGRIVLSDRFHHTVRLLTRSLPDSDAGPPQATYSLAALAGGDDAPGFADARGGAARFNRPRGVAVLPDGRIVVADQGNNRIRAISLAGDVSTLAGTGAPGGDDGAAGAATFKEPEDVATDAAGNVYIADVDNHRIRKLAGGQVTTIAGSGTQGWNDDADLMVASFFGMEGIEAAADGKTLWIADGNQNKVGLPYHRVRIVKLP